jgi:hypothetical protein
VASDDKKVVKVQFHPAPLESESAADRASRLRTEVERLSRLPLVEWMLYLDDTAKKHGIGSTKLKQMVEGVIREAEKKAREEKVEDRQRDRQQITAERENARKDCEKGREEERKREREEREAQKEEERKDKEKQKAFAAIVKLPGVEHEGKLAALARQLSEDLDVLREEFAELRIEEEDRIKRGEVEPWDEPVNIRELLDAVTAQFKKYIIIHDRAIAPIVPLNARYRNILAAPDFSGRRY